MKGPRVILGTTLSMTFAPGTNVLGDVAGANWTFLLPVLELERILCIGAPRPAALVALSGFAEELVVLCCTSSAARGVRRVCGDRGLENVTVVELLPGEPFPLGRRQIDLAVVADASGARRFARDTVLRMRLRHTLRPEGLIYLPLNRWKDQLLGPAELAPLEADFGGAQLLWLTPIFGAEAHTFVPQQDHHTAGHFVSHGLTCPSIAREPLKKLESLAAGQRFLGQCLRRHGLLLGSKAAELSQGPPAYLRTLAAQAGIDLNGYRWGLSAPGTYASRKVLFFLFDGAGSSPRYIVKLTRGARFNERLENEYQALSILRERGIDDEETLPQPVFLGHHAGLAIVGETVVEGTPLRQVSKGTIDCPYAQAAIERLIALGEAAVQTVPAGELADGLDQLLDRFVEIYRITSDEQAFLRHQIAVVRDSGSVPAVFQHGDPGPWNMLVTPSGHIGLLDWEAAEPRGVPLWDVLYFLRSHALGVARRRGVRNRLKAFSQYFDTSSPFHRLMADTIAHYCRRIGLPEHLVEPLFHTCWMHRALKEATRLPAARLQKGHFVELLRMCIRQEPLMRNNLI